MAIRSRPGGLSWVELARRTCRRSWEDEVFGQSARLAFYFFFALFPLLLLLLLVLGKTAGPASGWHGALLDSLNQILPLDVSQLLSRAVGQLNGSALAGGGALIACCSAIWSTLNGTMSILSGLHDAYEVQETRPWWRLVIVTVLMTICLCTLAFLALAGIRLLAGHPGASRSIPHWRRAMEWIIAVMLHVVCFALLYRFGPNLKVRRWRSSIPGAVIAAALWAVFTASLHLYQHYATSRQRIFGGLAPVASLLLWLYFTGGAIFLGAEANAVIAGIGRQQRTGKPHFAESETNPQGNQASGA